MTIRTPSQKHHFRMKRSPLPPSTPVILLVLWNRHIAQCLRLLTNNARIVAVRITRHSSQHRCAYIQVTRSSGSQTKLNWHRIKKQKKVKRGEKIKGCTENNINSHNNVKKHDLINHVQSTTGNGESASSTAASRSWSTLVVIQSDRPSDLS